MTALWDLSLQNGLTAELHGSHASIAIAELATGSTLGGAFESLRGQSVLLATREQLSSAVALLELDGVARRVVLGTPDLCADSLAHITATAAVDATLTDRPGSLADGAGSFTDNAALHALSQAPCYLVAPRPVAATPERRGTCLTEWVLLTSGTSGLPKLVIHTLESLAGALPRPTPAGRRCVWSTFYDIRRYGGLQIYLRALLGGAGLVLSSPAESVKEFFTRGAAHGVTHISGTPSHWRRVLMSGDASILSPAYVRLSGEIADQALLDGLKMTYPKAQVSHAFASTEAGVAFDVNDGWAGFPAGWVGKHGAVELQVHDGTLHVRSGRSAVRYMGGQASIAAGDGYVDTGDLVELRGERYHFLGRRGGIINVGGLKVYPEEVESVLNSDPRVRMSLVRARRNPVTGAVVAADVVLMNPTSELHDPPAAAALKADILSACRRALPAHKVPASIRFVTELDMTAAGKVQRPGA